MSGQSARIWRVKTIDDIGDGRSVPEHILHEKLVDGVWRTELMVKGPKDRNWVPLGDHPRLENHIPAKSWKHDREAEDVEVDMTPMIDVSFQLLIFFMIAATYMVQKTLDMPNPEADDGPALVTMAELEKDNIFVSVSGDQNVLVQKQNVAVEDLVQAIGDAAEESTFPELVLDADPSVPHELVVRIMDAAAAARIAKVYFVKRVPLGGK